MELFELKNVFDAGGLKSAVVTPAPLEKGYVLMVMDTKKKVTCNVCSTQR